MSEKEQVKEITWLGEEQSITVEKDLINVECHRQQCTEWERLSRENGMHERKHVDKYERISELKHVNSTWSD